MSTFAEAATRMGRVAGTFDDASIAQALSRAGVAGKRGFDPDASADTGGDRRLSGFGRGVRRGTIAADVRFDVESPRRVLMFAPAKRAAGLWKLLEAGSYKANGQWRMPRRRGRGRRAKGTVGTYPRASVPARRTWTKAVPKVRHTVVTEFHRTRGVQLRRAWG